MPKLRPGFGHRPAVLLIRCKKGIESNLSQCDDHAEASKQSKFFNQVRPAAFEFNPARLVLRRRAPDRRSDITTSELQTVVSMNRLWLIGKSRSMQRSVEPVAAAISRKYSAGAIASMRRRRQTHDQQPCIKITEPR